MLFISPLKLFSFLGCLNFCLDFLVIYKNDVIIKIRFISKFMMSQTGKQIIAIYILLNISKSKGNQTVKFGQKMECNMRNIFFEKSYAICDGKTIPRLFFKKNEHVSGSMSYCMPSWGLSKSIETVLQTTCFYLI